MRPLEEEAFQVDAYLDELLAITTTAPRALPEAIEPEVEWIARVVQRALARFHPSFHFEERLADRLAREALAAASPASGGSGSGISVGPPSMADLQEPVSISTLPLLVRGDQGLAPATAGGPVMVLELRGRGGLLLGGAIASGVSIAGAALIARARRARAEQRWQELG
jgi:hypothetical protein